MIILSTGQSNMPQAVPYSWAPPPNLFVWELDASIQPSAYVGGGFAPASSSEVGPSIAAAAVIAEKYPNEKIYVINCFRGGLGLVNWSGSPPSYNFRQVIENNVLAALSLIDRSSIDAFIFGGAEADANSQSQTIASDFENWVIGWLNERTWFNPSTPIYIFGMSPWAQSAPNNGDYLWRRYNGALRQIVAINPSHREYIDLDDFPISFFNGPTGVAGDIPYIHRTAEGYFQSGVKLARAMMGAVKDGISRAEGLDGLFTPSFSSFANCAVVLGYAYWRRVGNTIDVDIRCTITPTSPNVQTGFKVSTPVKAKLFPNNVSGLICTANGDAGIAIGVPGEQNIQTVFIPKSIGASAACLRYSYRVNPSDQLPNSPPGTT